MVSSVQQPSFCETSQKAETQPQTADRFGRFSDAWTVDTLGHLQRLCCQITKFASARETSLAQCPPVAVTLQTFVGVTGEWPLRRNDDPFGHLDA